VSILAELAGGKLPTIAEIRERAAAFHDGKNGFANSGKKNAYVCDGTSAFSDKPGCGHYIVTIDLEPGVTPFSTKCGHCGQLATSKGYRVAGHLVPTHEWHRPETLEGLVGWQLDHVSNGGLLMRPVAGGSGDWRAQ
jgi:hypothetical protein